MNQNELETSLSMIESFVKSNPEFEIYHHETDLGKLVAMGAGVNYSGGGVKDKMVRVYKKGTEKPLFTFSYQNILHGPNKGNYFVHFNFTEAPSKATGIDGLPFYLFEFLLDKIASNPSTYIS